MNHCLMAIWNNSPSFVLYQNNKPLDIFTTILYTGVIMNRKETIEFIAGIEMQDIKPMRKKNLLGLVRELLEDKLYEMSDEALADYYFEVTGQ